MDEFADRGRLMAGIDRILASSVNSHEAQEIGQLMLFGGADLGGSEELLSGLPPGTRVSAKEALGWEKELIGVYVSSHPLQQMTVDLVGVVTHSSADITEELNKLGVVLAGMVMEVRTITTKKGDTMAFVRLEDLQGQVEVTVFPRLWEQTKTLWVADKIVIVNGKVDVRNGRAGVLADFVQDYVEGIKVLEDRSSAAYRFRQGDQPARPDVRERPAAGNYAPAIPPVPRYAAARVDFGAQASDDDEDGFNGGDENPFANDRPDWLDEDDSRPATFARVPPISVAPAKPRDQDGPRPAATSTQQPASQPAPSESPVRPALPAVKGSEDSKPGETTTEGRVATPSGSKGLSPAGTTEPAREQPMAIRPPGPAVTRSTMASPSGLRPGDATTPATGMPGLSGRAFGAPDGHPSVMMDRREWRTLRITFRRSGSLDIDRRRLAELVATLGRYPGKDRFEIVVEAVAGPRYQLDFPNNSTGLCPQLENDLTACVGAGNWRTE